MLCKLCICKLYTWFKRILRGNFKAFLWTCFCWKVPVWSRTPKTCFTIERLWKTPSQILDPQLSPYCNIVFTYHNAFWKYEATSPVNPVRASPNPRLSSHHSTAGPLRKNRQEKLYLVFKGGFPQWPVFILWQESATVGGNSWSLQKLRNCPI